MSIPHNNQGPPPAGPPPNNNGPPLVVRPNEPAPRSMKELCQPSINGRGGPIAPILIQAMDFGLRHHMIQQVQNTCQFHRLLGDDANRHIDKFLEITQHMKQNGVSDDALCLSLFLYSLTHHAIAWYDRLPRNSIHSFNDMMRKFLLKYFPPSMVTKLRNEITHRDTINVAVGGTFTQKTPEECYELIENMTAHHSHWDTSSTRDETSINISSTTTIESPEVVRQLEMLNKNFLDMMRQIQSVKSVSLKCETCGGPHSFTECPSVDGHTQEAAYATTDNPRGDVKAITTRSGVSYDGPTIPPTPSPLPKEVECETDAVKDKEVELETEAAKDKALNDQKLREKDNNQMLKFLQFFQKLHFDISFADALLHMPKFASTFRSLLSNKEKLFELANTPLNENCSAVLLKQLPEKLGDPDKFLIPYVACEEYAQEVLGFSDSSTSGNPTPSDPIIASSSPSFTPFEGGDFILEEIKTFLRTSEELSNLDDDYYDTEGDILYL
ncbi:hypothetical protein Tco_1213526 [Tanacetum coccineum]